MKRAENNKKKYFKYLMILPLVFFTFCQNIDEDPIYEEQEMMTKSDKVVELMCKIAKNNSKKVVTDNSCTGFKYPMTLYSCGEAKGTLNAVTVKDDEELLDFFNQLTTKSKFYIDFPVRLVDAEEKNTIIYNVKELEGSLKVAIDICERLNNNDNDSSGNNYEYCDNNNKKVYICHNGNTICVSVNAIWSHLNKHPNDKLGKCN